MMAVSYELLDETLTVGMDRAGCQRTVKIAGSDVLTYLDERFAVTTVAGIGYVLHIRSRHPYFSWLSIENFQVDTMPKGSGATDSPNLAIVDSEFVRVVESYGGEVLKPNMGKWPYPPVTQGSYITRTRATSADIQTVPGRNFQWENDSKPIPPDINAGLVRPKVSHTIVWKRVRNPPRAVIDAAAGHVNDAESWTGSNGAAECVLFIGASESDAYIDQDLGVTLVDITFSFEEYILWDSDGEQWITHNHYFRSETPGASETGDSWDKLVRKDDPTKFTFETADFDAMFVQA